MASPPPSETFSFASPVSSETYEEEHALDFDYESWIQQSKIAAARYYSKLWMGGTPAESFVRGGAPPAGDDDATTSHPEEEDYELSLRDLAELSSSSSSLPASRATTAWTPPCPAASNTKPSPRSSLQGAAGFIINLFMPSPSAGHGRCMQNYTRRRRSNGSMPGKSYHDSKERYICKQNFIPALSNLEETMLHA
ncbi:hypothetical protein BS78_06G296200 [Paspalum vaginatum]|nr:hypothetical protein BS78_06G296200 [Paspalum vaginatum]